MVKIYPEKWKNWSFFEIIQLKGCGWISSYFSHEDNPNLFHSHWKEWVLSYLTGYMYVGMELHLHGGHKLKQNL